MQHLVSNSLDLVTEQYDKLERMLQKSQDNNEKTILLRRLANLAGVMEFLVSARHLGGNIHHLL